MLSTEFAIATADLNLDGAYRSLEQMQNVLRTFEETLTPYKELLGDSRTTPVTSEGETNDDFDPELATDLQTWEHWHGKTVKILLSQAEEIVAAIEDQQEALRGAADAL